ncbi:MAG TPA: pilus assembly protein TadG-related protein [Gaiellaceae bacterium]|nr:pilus assembly protein TadG-related protein [Gaiellaceae bacterium]
MPTHLPRRSAPHTSEQGQVIVIFALLLPVLLALGGIVIGIGNWYTHTKHLQTKVDASALAGGGVWGFPCGADVDARIEEEARRFVGPHTKADGTQYLATTLNPQVGGVSANEIHAVLNGTTYYDDDSNPNPLDRNDPAPNSSICASKFLDVKATEDNSFPLFSLLPVFPDLKRKARVRIEQAADFGGLLPIAVRVPTPVSAAAIFVNEEPGPGYGSVLGTAYMRQMCNPPAEPTCLTNIPSGLAQWTTNGATGSANWARIAVGAQVGVVVALSFRRACSNPPGPAGGGQCFDIDFTKPSLDTVDEMCNQGSGAGIVQCFYGTGSGSSQVFQSGLQFIHGYQNVTVGANEVPRVESVWLDGATGTNCFNGGYFSAPVANDCTGTLHVALETGGLPSDDVNVKYGIVYGNTSPAGDSCLDGQNRPNCDLAQGSLTATVNFDRRYARHAIALRVRVKDTTIGTGPGATNCGNNFSATCQWFFVADGVPRTNWPNNGNQVRNLVFSNPVQRGFMGNIDRSGPLKYLQLWADTNLDGTADAGFGETGPAASVETGTRQFQVDLGLQGAVAKTQDEVPIQLNIGATSQSSVLDCDPDISNLKDEIVQGCGPDRDPIYAKHSFDYTPYCPTWNGINNFFALPKPAPWDQDWPPFRCVATQTASAPNQVIQGLNERLFGDPTNPSCPSDTAAFRAGRNYWHDANNAYVDPVLGEDYYTFARPSRGHGNLLRNDDPRYVLLFMTPYNSFTGNGNEIYPIVLIGAFYITGYGQILGNGTLINEDPCTDGNSDPRPGTGNKPPPDLDTSNSNAVAWGHFVTPVNLGTSSGSTGVECREGGFDPCVAVLVE